MFLLSDACVSEKGSSHDWEIFLRIVLWITVDINKCLSVAPELLSRFFFFFKFWYVMYNQIKENEVGRACGNYKGEEKCMQSFSGKICRKETSWKT